MKFLPACLAAILLLFANAARGTGESRLPANRDAQPRFLETGKWWNFSFADGNDPVGSTVNAVKVLQLSETHPSWVQIAYPRSRKKQYSMFGPASMAHDDPSIDLDAALADWEKSVTDWKVIWVNLEFVVAISKVEQSHPTAPADEPISPSPPAR